MCNPSGGTINQEENTNLCPVRKHLSISVICNKFIWVLEEKKLQCNLYYYIPTDQNSILFYCISLNSSCFGWRKQDSYLAAHFSYALVFASRMYYNIFGKLRFETTEI